MTGPRLALFDFRTAAMRRMRAQKLGGETFLADSAVEGVADRVGTATRRFDQAVMVGGALPDALRVLAADWHHADFDQTEFLKADGGPFDLAVSILSLQAINDLPGALAQIRRALKPDGLFVGVLLGGMTLTELRESFASAESQTLGGISPRVSPFADVRELGGLLQRAGFALPVADVERVCVRYQDFSGLVRDLRAHGLTNVMGERRKVFLRRATLAALLDHYRAHHAQDGKLKASFEFVYLTGWSPHESQQQPLKPGSATARLAEVLGTSEVPLSEVPSPPTKSSY